MSEQPHDEPEADATEQDSLAEQTDNSTREEDGNQDVSQDPEVTYDDDSEQVAD